MDSQNSEIANTIKAIESIAPEGYGRMSIPSQTDEELHEQILITLQSEDITEFVLNQVGIDCLFTFTERMASQCLRESDFQSCSLAAQAMELVFSQPDYDEKMTSVALALIHDSYFRLSEPRPEFDKNLLPRFNNEWMQFCSQFEHDQSISSTLFRIGTEHDGLRYICYW